MALVGDSSFDRGTIGKIENDQVIPKFTTFNSLAYAFEMNPLELLEEIQKDIRRARMRKKESEKNVQQHAAKGKETLVYETTLYHQQKLRTNGRSSGSLREAMHTRQRNKQVIYGLQTPLEILDESIRSIGYNLRGAIESSKRLLGIVHCCPVLVNPIDRIVVFPQISEA
ncbi:competence protein ComK [Bacillus sp. JJ1532]|uniref:competence protein ComK n=1 Tax=Bacillus sp. JJ1532 TaxID=3122958 RepID=UPI002FFF792F